MQRYSTLFVIAAALAATGTFSVISVGQQPGQKLPGTVPTPSKPKKEELPPFNAEKYFYSVGMGTGYDAKAQNTEVDFESLQKGILDGLEGEHGSYLYGLTLGAQLKKQLAGSGIQMDMDQYMAGLRDVLNGRVPAVSAEEAQQQELALRIEAVKKRGEIQGQISKKYMDRNAARESVRPIATGRGLIQIEMLEPSLPGQDRPTDGDRLTLSYNCYILDGTKWRKLNGSEGTPLEVVVGLNMLGEGMDYALQEMKLGSRYRFVIPPELGFGSDPAGGVPPNAAVLFDVRMHKHVPGKLEGVRFPGAGGR